MEGGRVAGHRTQLQRRAPGLGVAGAHAGEGGTGRDTAPTSSAMLPQVARGSLSVRPTVSVIIYAMHPQRWDPTWWRA